MYHFNASPPRSRCAHDRGFTLIEILVVVVIVSVLAGIATLAIGGGQQRALRSEALRLQQLLSFAMDEAAYRYRQFGLLTEERHYQLMIFDADRHRWQTAPEEAFGPHALPDFLHLQLRVEGQGTQRPEIDVPVSEQRGNRPAKQPQLLILSSGEITPFELELSLQGVNPPRLARLSSDGLAAIALEYSP